MKVFMLGWEFPPFNVGGLGVACHGLAKSLVKNGAEVSVVLPKAPDSKYHPEFNLISAQHTNYKISEDKISSKIKVTEVKSLLTPYMSSEAYTEKYNDLITRIKKKVQIENIEGEFSDDIYGNNILEEVYRYAYKVSGIAGNEDFDVIHAHDWMTYPAGIAAKEASGKPLIVHIHNTSFDRSGGNPNPSELKIEQEGFDKANKVIAISNFVKNTLISKYNVPLEKIEVVHNGIDTDNYAHTPHESKLTEKDKIVLFAGRITLQKGPDYFIRAAKRISEKRDDVKFVLAGNGDMYERMIDFAADLGISEKFIFTGKYNKEQGQKLMSMADVFVMPSIAEPFGLVPLEAMMQKTPTVISKQSGVSEVVANTLKVDFWNIDSMANKIMAALDYSALHEQLREYGEKEAQSMTWDTPAKSCIDIFNQHI